ncbi:hypothetical protein L3X38_009951 [Prunus dulcis]|uniref:Uncharacterized protein n=1 Tax=Prunus dulcis TaxID=3755 RepID=A0AAD4WH27_PRUDU|nr:hypothetical protein L3X38_009951 [Prunus dulcis]
MRKRDRLERAVPSFLCLACKRSSSWLMPRVETCTQNRRFQTTAGLSCLGPCQLLPVLDVTAAADFGRPRGLLPGRPRVKRAAIALSLVPHVSSIALLPSAVSYCSVAATSSIRVLTSVRHCKMEIPNCVQSFTYY